MAVMWEDQEPEETFDPDEVPEGVSADLAYTQMSDHSIATLERASGFVASQVGNEDIDPAAVMAQHAEFGNMEWAGEFDDTPDELDEPSAAS